MATKKPARPRAKKHVPWSEHRMIRTVIALFWMFFWLLNVIDKFVSEPTFLWVGKDRAQQFADYFASVGVTNLGVVFVFLLVVTLLELVAFVLAAVSLTDLIRKDSESARSHFLATTLLGLLIFLFFTIGDQAFGDRFELMEHTIYFTAILVSWAAFAYLPEKKKRASRAKPKPKAKVKS